MAGHIEPPETTEAVQIDHILLGTGNLQDGMDRMEELTGIRAVPGGEHPELGTHNALLSLGNRQYLEIIAPRPGADLAEPFRFLRDVSRLSPVSWAIATTNARRTADRISRAGYETTEIVPGSRRQGDGSLLEWQMFRLAGLGINGPPFFIEWGASTAHPSERSPAGCELVSIELAHPASETLGDILRILGIGVHVSHSLDTRMHIQLTCPRGTVSIQRP